MSGHELEPAAPEAAPAFAPAAPVSGIPLGPLPTRAASLARMGVDQRAAAVRALSAGAGNANVARALQRSILSDIHEFKYGIEIDLPVASTEEKLAEIRRLQGKGNGLAIREVWESIPDLAEVAKANAPLFLSCARGDPGLLELEAFDGVRTAFEHAVEQRVLANLRANRDYVSEQMNAVGVSANADAEQAQSTAEQDAAVRNAQVLAEKVALWQEGMAKAKLVKVGRNTRMKSGGYRSEMAHEVEEDATFDPEKPPQIKGAPAGRESEFHDYNEIKTQYDVLDNGVKKVLAESPAVFAIVSGAGGLPGQAAKEFAAQDTTKARAQLGAALTKLGSKIDEAVPLVGDGLDHRDFIPVHQQLFASPEFSGEFEKAIIGKDIEGHEMGKVLRSLSLGALTAAAFLVAEFATAGMATFIAVAVGVGASATNAGLSLDDYFKKAKAAGASTGDARNDIVSQEQVDSALFQAVLDTALAIIDAAVGIASAVSKLGGPAAKLAAAAEAGMAKAGSAGLGEALSGADHAAKVMAIQKSLTEAGINQTVAASGRTAEELAAIVGKESEAGKRLLAAAGLGQDAAALEGLAAKLSDLGALTRTEKETVMRQAIDQFGYADALRRAGGWEHVTKTLGESSPISVELEGWRSRIVQDLQSYMEAASKGESQAVRTGTEAPTSDVDVSTVGKDAGQHVDRALEFASKRAGCSREELGKLIDLDAAVNPARMHLQDVVKGLSPQARSAIEREAARFEEGLTYARRYHQAEKAGDQALMKQIEQEAGGRLNKSFQPLDQGQIAALQKRMDDWSAQLAKLEADGAGEAEKTALIQQIGRTQAEVLASSPTMYGTGGSIRTWITERAAAAGVKSDLEKLAAAGVKIDPAAATIWPGQRFTAILGEGHFLDRAFAGIATGEGAALVKAIKDFGKHGGRVVEVLGRDVAVTGMSAAKMDELADALALWVKRSKGPLADAVRDAAEVARLRTELAGQVAQLRGAMNNGIGALRAQAQLGEALSAADLAGIDAWVRAQAAAEARAQALLNNMLKLEQAAKAAVVAGANAAQDSSEPEPNTSTPDGPVYSPPE